MKSECHKHTMCSGGTAMGGGKQTKDMTSVHFIKTLNASQMYHT